MQSTPVDFRDYQRYKLHEATKRFRESEEYTLFKNKKIKAYKDLENRFNPKDFEFIDECIGIFVEVEYQKMEFIYVEAYKDCVKLLKKLEVLV